MAATMKQIAELAGVSIGTVDRALNNRGRINPEVKKRILRIAESLDYAPNKVAKSLVSRKKNLKIGFILHVRENHFHDAILAGIDRAANHLQDSGIEILIRESSNTNIQEQLRHIDDLISENVSGLAISAINAPPILEKLRELKKQGLPIVSVGGASDEDCFLCHVGQDSFRKGCILANLLNLIVPNCNLLIFTFSLQLSGPQNTIMGLRQCIAQEYPTISISDIVELTEDEFQNYEIVRHALNQHPNASAVLFTSDIVAGGLHALRDALPALHLRAFATFFSPVIEKALDDGLISAAVWSDHEITGYRAMMTLYDYLVNHQSPPSFHIYSDQIISIKHSCKLQGIDKYKL